MSVSVLDRKMRGLCCHHLDADLDLDPNSRSKCVSSSTNWDSQDKPELVGPDTAWLASIMILRTLEYFTFRVKLEIVQYGLALRIFDGQQAKLTTKNAHNRSGQFVMKLIKISIPHKSVIRRAFCLKEKLFNA